MLGAIVFLLRDSLGAEPRCSFMSMNLFPVVEIVCNYSEKYPFWITFNNLQISLSLNSTGPGYQGYRSVSSSCSLGKVGPENYKS